MLQAGSAPSAMDPVLSTLLVLVVFILLFCLASSLLAIAPSRADPPKRHRPVTRSMTRARDV